ncbi:3'-5' exonuclease [Methyloversatilis discipulorum]|jgi:superfamily I DNA/RNA helicase/mRNA-degrading endonuclease RelE of RelBE toxin-antitoxin system|uniref:3'-5' exonuclease n=1 Tax=Methyloversatilis discipulorum TaxID=1119528 RepID=UPI003F2CD70C
MEFRIADTFTDSLGRLTGEEQKLVKTTAFDLQLNPASPGLSFHKLDRARDKHFWSVRVGRDLRIIVHRNESSLLLCYVDHHDKAYDWAERRKLETHPKTGAAQLIEIRETVREVSVPYALRSDLAPQPDLVAAEPRIEPLFRGVADDQLLSYGVPPEWLPDVKRATEDSLLTLADHLPAEAAEALLELATGGSPRVTAPTSGDPFAHPDAQRRFRVMSNVEELQRALDYPWDKWTVFLHPEQRQWVERDYNGPARVSGSAGTGKTIVALHRAAWLARQRPDARVLLTTFSDTLARALQIKLNRLLAHEPRLAERIDVHSLEAIGVRLFKTHVGAVKLASREVVRRLMADAASAVTGHKFARHFLLAEWEHVVDAWQLDHWEAYRDVARLGRKTRLPEAQRAVLWQIFERVQEGLRQQCLMTASGMFCALADVLRGRAQAIFDFAVVDEAQDLGVAHLRFLLALAGGTEGPRPDALFFAGDTGQRIFQQPFSWKSIGVDVRGRSRTLRVNYRTSHQIRSQADRLLGPSVSDADGNVDERHDTVSVFNGPSPRIEVVSSPELERELVADALEAWIKCGIQVQEIAVFVRSEDQMPRALEALEQAKLPCQVLDDSMSLDAERVSVATMHLAKGLEFRAVVVMCCDDEVVPLQARIESVGEDADLKEVYETERHLLYVACTRARDRLLLTAVSPESEFLDDMRGR